MNKKLLPVFLMMVFFSCKTKDTSSAVFQPISISTVFSESEKYNNQDVSVTGRLTIDFENYSLKDCSLVDGQKKNGAELWLDFQNLDPFKFESLSGRMVVVTGKFAKGRSGHLGGYLGRVSEIKKIEEVK